MSDTLGWLWSGIAGPVWTALKLDPLAAGDDHPPRIWWSALGLLSYLPIHAAGTAREGSSVLDRVVSSYTPTVFALAQARRRLQPASDDQRLLIVSMPTTPGAADLQGAGQEADMLAERFPAMGSLGTWPGATGPATRETVMEDLPQYAFAHFACHGQYDPADPSGSSLALDDRADHPLTMADIAGLDLARAQLAYLSACDTARTTPSLTNEALHLVTAFSIAGYPHVIGTLWKLNDVAGPRVAKLVYAAMHGPESGPPLDVRLAPRAVHEAVRQMRSQLPAYPTLWAAHIHGGAWPARQDLLAQRGHGLPGPSQQRSTRSWLT